MSGVVVPICGLSIADSGILDRCKGALVAMGADFIDAQSESPDRPFDIFIGSDPARFLDLQDRIAAQLPALFGTLLIAESGAADVVLPRDFAPRELQAACRLLAEIVRLRRQLQQPQACEPLASSLVNEALLDHLTGSANRRAWDAELRARVTAASAGQSLCLAIFDVDYLKQVNAAWGHAAGDHLLRSMAQALRDSLRQVDFVARLGGDEFGVLLSGLAGDETSAILERVRSGLPGRLARAGSKVAGVSVGYIVYAGPPAIDAEVLVAAADRALRRAKEHGRDTAVRGELARQIA